MSTLLAAAINSLLPGAVLFMVYKKYQKVKQMKELRSAAESTNGPVVKTVLQAKESNQKANELSTLLNPKIDEGMRNRIDKNLTAAVNEGLSFNDVVEDPQGVFLEMAHGF